MKAKTVECKLHITLQYDPETTDPESLASAMDTLLETALSTPGVLDDYGTVQLSEFYVSKNDEETRIQAACQTVRRYSDFMSLKASREELCKFIAINRITPGAAWSGASKAMMAENYAKQDPVGGRDTLISEEGFQQLKNHFGVRT